MPYVEIRAPQASAAHKKELVSALTRNVVELFEVMPSTVTVFFETLAREDYGHEGVLGLPADGARVFVKVHAYRRSIEQRRNLAQALTPLLADCFGTSAGNVAVYFLDRQHDEVAHGGSLACDAHSHLPLSLDL